MRLSRRSTRCPSRARRSRRRRPARRECIPGPRRRPPVALALPLVSARRVAAMTSRRPSRGWPHQCHPPPRLLRAHLAAAAMATSRTRSCTCAEGGGGLVCAALALCASPKRIRLLHIRMVQVPPVPARGAGAGGGPRAVPAAGARAHFCLPPPVCVSCIRVREHFACATPRATDAHARTDARASRGGARRGRRRAASARARRRRARDRGLVARARGGRPGARVRRPAPLSRAIRRGARPAEGSRGEAMRGSVSRMRAQRACRWIHGPDTDAQVALGAPPPLTALFVLGDAPVCRCVCACPVPAARMRQAHSRMARRRRVRAGGRGRAGGTGGGRGGRSRGCGSGRGAAHSARTARPAAARVGPRAGAWRAAASCALIDGRALGSTLWGARGRPRRRSRPRRCAILCMVWVCWDVEATPSARTPQAVSGLGVELSGALGRRTKFQAFDTPQVHSCWSLPDYIYVCLRVPHVFFSLSACNCHVTCQVTPSCSVLTGLARHRMIARAAGTASGVRCGRMRRGGPAGAEWRRRWRADRCAGGGGRGHAAA